MAKIHFNEYKDKSVLEDYIHKILLPHKEYIKSNEWSGIPELTNSNNSICKDSCRTQAWSIATILQSLDFLENN